MESKPYLVLARKYRPQTFEAVVGQDHIVTTLKNAVTLGRVGHAYLFTGPRGVGKVFYQEKPLGKGNALKLGFQHATGNIILIQDADLEYKPEEYGKLLEPILSGQTSFVLGSRPLAKESWTIRKYPGYFFYARLLNLGGFFYTMLFNALYFIWLTDPATMFKVFKKECISGLTFKSNYFDLDWELVSKLVRKGYKPLEVPVSYHSRSTAEGKKIRFLRDGFLVFLAIVRYRFFD